MYTYDKSINKYVVEYNKVTKQMVNCYLNPNNNSVRYYIHFLSNYDWMVLNFFSN